MMGRMVGMLPILSMNSKQLHESLRVFRHYIPGDSIDHLNTSISRRTAEYNRFSTLLNCVKKKWEFPNGNLIIIIDLKNSYVPKYFCVVL